MISLAAGLPISGAPGSDNPHQKGTAGNSPPPSSIIRATGPRTKGLKGAFQGRLAAALRRHRKRTGKGIAFPQEQRPYYSRLLFIRCDQRPGRDVDRVFDHALDGRAARGREQAVRQAIRAQGQEAPDGCPGPAVRKDHAVPTGAAQPKEEEPQTLDASSQYGYDAQGRKLNADSTAGIYANSAGGGAFLNDINPGNSATAVVVFDIPKDGKLTKLELHDSPFSGGVDVAVA